MNFANTTMSPGQSMRLMATIRNVTTMNTNIKSPYLYLLNMYAILMPHHNI